MKIRSIFIRSCFHNYRSAKDWCWLLHVSISQNNNFFLICFITTEAFGPPLPYLGNWQAPTSVHVHLHSLNSAVSPVITGKVLSYSNMSRGAQQSWWRGWKECPVGSGWALWAYLVWRKGGWGATSLPSTASSGGEVEREVLSCSPWNPVIGHVGMVHSCTRGGSDLTLGSISLPRWWPNTGTGFLERWSMHHPYQCLRGIWTMPLTICFNFWSALKRSGSWTRWLLYVPSNWTILFYLER